MSRAGLACVALLLFFVAHNVRLAVLNQDEPRIVEQQRFDILSRNIERASSANDHPIVLGRVAHYYYLERRIRGAKLRLSSSFAPVAWDFEHVARLQVDVSEKPLVVDPRRQAWLRLQCPKHRSWFVYKRRGGHRVYQHLWIKLDARTDEYVLAETTRGRDLFFVPRRLYEAAAAPDTVQPGMNPVARRRP